MLKCLLTHANFSHYCFATTNLEYDAMINDRYLVISTSLDASSGGEGEIL